MSKNNFEYKLICLIGTLIIIGVTTAPAFGQDNNNATKGNQSAETTSSNSLVIPSFVRPFVALESTDLI